MLIAINNHLHRQRRRIAVAAALLGLVGAVVVAHSAMGDEHMADGLVVCVAVAESALLAAGAVIALGGAARRPILTLPTYVAAEQPGYSMKPWPRARAGPAATQVFRL